ncbi:hypothetical protein BCR42DRAFT_19809 [Absidia repens]|uniref:Uncharacterized protein n=1 Tax=Absidia repens TaxID=90262 RepID=A0A1X2J2S3_9FUNG|nr:hypothetical protein BCR42DRAFT_19809 [Absidia repens]
MEYLIICLKRDTITPSFLFLSFCLLSFSPSFFIWSLIFPSFSRIPLFFFFLLYIYIYIYLCIYIVYMILVVFVVIFT